ncbi:hypothetical protein DFH06DRAFT_1128045 [Mycena polygramma]|nr:hypothetical protein DFH06DRAFT_1128045 [Mycena polygramma]
MQLQEVPDAPGKHITDLWPIRAHEAAALHPTLFVNDLAVDDAVVDHLADVVLCILLRVEVQLDADVALDARSMHKYESESRRILELCRMLGEGCLELREREPMRMAVRVEGINTLLTLDNVKVRGEHLLKHGVPEQAAVGDGTHQQLDDDKELVHGLVEPRCERRGNAQTAGCLLLLFKYPCARARQTQASCTGIELARAAGESLRNRISVVLGGRRRARVQMVQLFSNLFVAELGLRGFEVPESDSARDVDGYRAEVGVELSASESGDSRFGIAPSFGGADLFWKQLRADLRTRWRSSRSSSRPLVQNSAVEAEDGGGWWSAVDGARCKVCAETCSVEGGGSMGTRYMGTRCSGGQCRRCGWRGVKCGEGAAAMGGLQVSVRHWRDLRTRRESLVGGQDSGATRERDSGAEMEEEE